jgi:hypothetical protein
MHTHACNAAADANHLVEAVQPLVGVCLPEYISHAAVLDRPTTHALGLHATAAAAVTAMSGAAAATNA